MDLAVPPSKRGAIGERVTGHLVPRVARIEPGPVMTHFARPSRRAGPKSAVPGCSLGRRGLSGNTRHLPRCDAGYRGSVRERSYCAAFFMGGCPRVWPDGLVRMFPLPTSVIPLIFGTINFRNNTNNTEDLSLLSPGSGVRAASSVVGAARRRPVVKVSTGGRGSVEAIDGSAALHRLALGTVAVHVPLACLRQRDRGRDARPSGGGPAAAP